MYSVITYTIAHTCMLRTVSMSACYKVIAQDESALPLTSTGPGSTNLSTAQCMEWPEWRCDHATTCVSGPLLVIVGGLSSELNTISDCWIGDLTTKQWKKV